MGDSSTTLPQTKLPIATLGVACVSNDASHCEQILREIVAFVEESRLDAEVIDVETEVIGL